ncbi:MAG TPA: GAF domain-containing protein, partial [Gammaproteobacteria bacterium]|nr:GAF domain-containing protein [Gammaproteobacteria bacterium]
MQRRYGLLIPLSVLLVAAALYNGGVFFFSVRLPMNIELVDGHTAEISPLANTPLPAPLVAGDRIELGALDASARAAVDIALEGRTFPLEHTYEFNVSRNGVLLQVPITTIKTPPSTQWRWIEGLSVFASLMTGIMSLLLLWYGRDRAAEGMAMWSMGYVIGVLCNAMPVDGTLGVIFLLASDVCFAIARIGFYVMAESLVGSTFSNRTRMLFRAAFILLLTVGAAQPLVGTSLLAFAGWGEILLPKYSVLFSWIYIIPIAMLVIGSRSVEARQRMRLRWVMWSAIGILISVSITNAIPIGFVAATAVTYISFTLATCGFMYSLLRYRVVDLNVVVDRALVYGGVTMLVVGIIATVNSLALRATLGEGTGPLLQVVVPLALGIVLGKVRTYMDKLVERVLFRRKYLADKALRTFARRCGHMQDVPHLLEAAVKEIQKHTGSLRVALYAAADTGYTRVNQSPDARFPEKLQADDPAMVATRAEHQAIDLEDLESGFGTDGCVFPMMVLGVLRGVLVCANRPGERYAADDKKLLTHVARDVGAAWRILRAR